jgi:beta-lactamase class A
VSRHAVQAAIEAFSASNHGRSVAVESLRGAPVLAAVRADIERPGASLLKLPLVAAALAGDVERRVRVEELGRTEYASVLAALDPSRELSVRELCALCLVTSDNPVADHLLELVGIDAVNERAEALGCTGTRMEVGFSDDVLGPAGRANVTTAADAMILVRALADDPVAGRAMLNSLHNLRIPLRLAEDVRVAHKTGTLLGVANDAGVIYGDSTDLAVAFLCDGEADTAWASIEIGDCVGEIWDALGERTARPPAALSPRAAP